MIVRMTDAFSTNLLSGVPIPTMLNNGELRLYTGEEPYDLMDPTGVLLGTIRGNAGEFPLYSQSGPQVALADTVTWSLDIVATGTPGYLLAIPNPGYPGARILTSYMNFPEITALTQHIVIPQTFFSITGA